MESEEVLGIFRRNGLQIELGAQYSVRGQIAQLLNGCKVYAEYIRRESYTMDIVEENKGLLESIKSLRAQLEECESNREKWRDACETQGFKLAEVEERLDRLVEGMENVVDRLDDLADQWGDEGVFRRCRDNLRALLWEARQKEE